MDGVQIARFERIAEFLRNLADLDFQGLSFGVAGSVGNGQRVGG
jgi:hypothetical protein